MDNKEYITIVNFKLKDENGTWVTLNCQSVTLTISLEKPIF